MANIKITDLTAYTAPETTDVMPIVDVTTDTTKKVAVGEVVGKITGDVDVATDGTSSITAGAIVNADVNANAEIAVSKLADGTARQLLQTDAAGTGVEWTSNIDVPGTLDVTGATTLDSTLQVGGNTTIEGNLTVEGTTTTIETTTLLVEDKNIEMGVVGTPTDTTADGGGITLKGATDKTLNWLNATDSWTSSENIDLANGKSYRINNTEVLSSTTLGGGVTGSSLTSVGTISSGTWQGTAIDAAYLDGTVVTTGDTGTVTSTMIADGTIVNADIDASAAIAGTKIDPDFGSQTIETTGVINAGSGTEAAPSVSVGTTDNGLYSPGTDEVALSTNGTEAARIDSSGRLLVGTSSTSATNALVLQGSNGGTYSQSIFTLANADSSITDDNILGSIRFSDNSHDPAVVIESRKDGGAWTSGSSHPTRLVFSTTADGASSPTERLYIYNNGNLRSPSTYNLTSATAANCIVDNAGYFKRSTSSAKYKTEIETAQDLYSDAILNCRPVWYRSTCDGDNPAHSWWGFIAEEVAAIDPRLVHWKTVEVTYDENGSTVETPCEPEPEGVQYDRFVPHLLNLIKRQKEQIESQGASITALEARLAALESA
jgi:hypothetical protein